MHRRRWKNSFVTCVLSLVCIFCWRRIWTLHFTSNQPAGIPLQVNPACEAVLSNGEIVNSGDGCGITNGDNTNPEKGNPNIKKIMDVNPRREDARNFTFSECEYSDCAMTSDPAEADLLMFNGLRMEGITLPPRREGQIWLMYTREPPTAKKRIHLRRSDLRNQFNWTRTVLNDSTFPTVYGVIGERLAPVKNYETIFQRKDHVVAWFVSKCLTPSKREDYVRRMASHVSVHVYGNCGNRTCGSRGYEMGGSKTECLEMISRSYKFYLSFENSFCRDYITEKFYAMFNDVDVIPVVRGGGDYRRLFPDGIYINSDDFSSPERLGKYLKALSRDKSAYIRMLRNKNRFYLSFENSFCRDYITEKFYAMFNDVDVIPVVRGGGDYRRLFPDGIYINSDDFSSPERLGKYLKALSRDKSAYIRMLRNKNRYTLARGKNIPCELCKALHTRSPQNVYEDIYSWMLRPGNCWDPKDLHELQD